jgi:hypothetical protein
MAQMKRPSLRYFELARAVALSAGVKKYDFLVYQNEAYSKLAERRGQVWQPCVDSLGRLVR